jgi:hypothetical protein
MNAGTGPGERITQPEEAIDENQNGSTCVATPGVHQAILGSSITDF